MKNSTKSRTVGFYLTLTTTLLAILTAIVYISVYSSSEYISWTAFGLTAAAAVISSILIIIKKHDLSPLVSGVLVLIAFMFYFYGKYFYISVVMVGIDLTHFDNKFIISTILFSLLFVFSIINMVFTNIKFKAVITTTAILLALLVLSIFIVKENYGAVNAFLGAETFKVVETEGSEQVDTEYFKSDYNVLRDLMTEGAKVSRQVSAEGIVLLKNDNNVLPLRDGMRDVSLFGITTVDPVFGGTGSGAVNTDAAPTFKEAMENSGFTVNDTVWNFYNENKFDYGREELRNEGDWFSSGFTINEVPWKKVEDETGNSFVKFGDAAIVMLGRVGGEGADLSRDAFVDPTATDKNYLKLTTDEIDMLEALSREKGKSFSTIIVLLNSANQIETEFLNNPKYKIDAAMWVGSVGQEGLNAVADILSGSVVPSGRLSDMYWNTHDQNPVHANFGLHFYDNYDEYGLKMGFNHYVVYQEGIYLGYRYGETRYEDVVTGRANAGNFNYKNVISYPFGYGLSYTDFTYSNFSVIKEGKTYTAKVDVTNTGSEFSGKEVVQFYLQKPYTDYDITNGIEKAAVELVQFGKTKILAPGETQTITVEIDEKYFASYDASGAGTYVVAEGDYYITVARDSHDAVNNILAAKGYTTEQGMDSDGDPLFTARFNMAFDDKTYSVSSVTGHDIENLFDNADINRYEGAGENSVIYLSRNDWDGTVVLNRPVELSLNNAMMADLKAQTAPLEKDDVEYPNFGIDSGLKLINLRADDEGNPISFDDPKWDLLLDQLTWDDMTYLLSTGLRKTGAIDTIAKPETLDHNGPSGLTQPYSSGPLGLAIKRNDRDKDEQPMSYPSNGIKASTFNQELAYRVGELVGEDALWAGYAGLYGTGVNMHRSPYEGRAFEYYSEDPVLSGKIVAKESEGTQSRGCYVYLKHFVLNDQEGGRTGIATWANEQSIREIYLRAFELPIIEGGAKNVMQAFNRIGLVAAPNSVELMENYLRGEIGMEGFTVTDFYGSYGPVLSRPNTVLTGTDLPDGDIDPSKTFDEYKEGYGELVNAMRLATKRILYTVVHSNAMNGISANTAIVTVTPGYIIVIYTVIILLALCFVTFSILSFRKRGDR